MSLLVRFYLNVLLGTSFGKLAPSFLLHGMAKFFLIFLKIFLFFVVVSHVKHGQFSRKNSNFQGVPSVPEMTFQFPAPFKQFKDLH